MLYIYIYIYNIYMCVCVGVYVCIYIYREREKREIERWGERKRDEEIVSNRKSNRERGIYIGKEDKIWRYCARL